MKELDPEAIERGCATVEEWKRTTPYELDNKGTALYHLIFDLKMYALSLDVDFDEIVREVAIDYHVFGYKRGVQR